MVLPLISSHSILDHLKDPSSAPSSVGDVLRPWLTRAPRPINH